MFHRALLPMDLIHFMWHHCHPSGIVIFFVLTPSLHNFAPLLVCGHLSLRPGTTHTSLMVCPAVCVDLFLLAGLELYLFGKTFLFSFYCTMQVVPILYTVQDRNVPEEILKPELHSTTCSCDASWT